MSATSVAVDVGPLAGRRTGVGVAVAALVGELAARDDVDVVPYLTSFRADPDAGVRRLPLPAAVAHRLWARADHPRVDRWLRPAAVVHGTNYTVPPSRLPALVSVYDCWALEHPELVHPDVRRAGRVLRRAVARGAVVHASSAATAERARALLPRARVETVLLAALPLPDPAPVAPRPELQGAPFVLALGTIERRKNLPRLVDAFARAAPQLPDVRLVLAGGPGDDLAALDAAVERAGTTVAGRTLRTGFVDEASRGWLVRHATVLAYPSLDEGFGFPVLDAFQAGVPVVAARAGSSPEIAGDAALLVDPVDVDALAAGLVRAVTDDALRSALLGAAPARLAQLSWSATAAGLAALYRELAGGAG